MTVEGTTDGLRGVTDTLEETGLDGILGEVIESTSDAVDDIVDNTQVNQLSK